MFRIRDLLVRIRITVTFWYGFGLLDPYMITDPDPDPALFVSDFQDANKKKVFFEFAGVYILVENGYLFPPPLGNLYFFPKKTA